MRHKVVPGILLMGCLIACLGACSCFEDGDFVTLQGVVQFVDVEGGCWRIAGNDGVSYEPTNLPKEYQEDGLTVRVKARYRDDLVSRCMVGRLIQIISIDRVSAAG